MHIDNFFCNFSSHIDLETPTILLDGLINPEKLKSVFFQLDNILMNNYLFKYFICWLSYYIQEKKDTLLAFFFGEENLDFICSDFIKFCFSNKIMLDKEKTLNSFKIHNSLSDEMVKLELMKVQRKKRISLLGFGLDEGTYEKELAQFLLRNNVCEKVILYGLDPYANRDEAIYYLTPEQLLADKDLDFDIIFARWSLHHVPLQARWHDLIHCIDRCNPNAHVIFVEHGIVHKKRGLLEKKIYKLFNATFDIVANIGLRPNYFTQTRPNMGANFFIRYLTSKDFYTIVNTTSRAVLARNIYDVGPKFPNQTIYSFLIQ
jgi:hypothetical protein